MRSATSKITTPTTTTTTTTAAMNTSPKRCKYQYCATAAADDSHKLTDSNNESTLLPGLPNHLAQLCLCSLHPSLLHRVCRSWRRFIYSPSFPPFFSLYTLLSSKSPLPEPKNQDQDQNQLNPFQFFSLDPISSTWRRLPFPPSDPLLHLLHRHPSFISRTIPIQSLTVSGRLVLIAATGHQFLPALSHPLAFDPISSQWFFGPPLPTPRRWCAVGSAGGSVYVASGIGSHYDSDVARSVEKWDMKKKKIEWNWEKMASLKDGRFSREAVEAVEYRGKLCMVNVKGHAVKQGAVYDMEKNRWENMPEGMIGGWNGPAAMGGEDRLYVVDEANGVLSKYDSENDSWEEVVDSPEILRGAQHITAGGGRVCVVCGGGERIAVVDVVATPPRIWVVNPPEGREVVAVHILPRMNLPEW
ncbi:unnamed protein product [Ilex paraguariensis]|uniref:F-box/kelch-repeat protein SKIP25 n=1 Tax=Ilex paraguariensis TaxID=185542 RepID=A0ABC8U1Q0_9AQUA